jgi:D-glycero-D-manno-heptose 1,7-bisphosphate phosphatase
MSPSTGRVPAPETEIESKAESTQPRRPLADLAGQAGRDRIGPARRTEATGWPALFLDRDGVLNDPVWDYRSGSYQPPLTVQDVALVPGAAGALVRAAAAELPIVVVSNQPSAPGGVVTSSELHSVHARVLHLLSRHGIRVDASYLCLHPPAAGGTDQSPPPDQEPLPALLHRSRLLQRAAEELGLDLSRSWLVGDSDADVGAARNASMAGVVLTSHPWSTQRRGRVSSEADAVVSDLGAAIEVVLAQMRAAGTLPETWPVPDESFRIYRC